MYLTSISRILDNSFDNKLNLLSKTSWFWSGIAPTLKTFVLAFKGKERIEKNNTEAKNNFLKLKISFFSCQILIKNSNLK